MPSPSAEWPQGLGLRDRLEPGDLGRLIALHGEVYSDWPGFGLEFEAFVARTIAEYGLDNGFDGRIWLLERDDDGRELVGCSAIARRGEGLAQLRWILLKKDYWGSGLGLRLVQTALEWARSSGADRVYLETTDGLEASSTLYRRLGFRETRNEVVEMWAGRRPLIRMEMALRE